MTGVLELDINGTVSTLGIKDQPVYSPHLLLGLPEPSLQGAQLSYLLPLGGKPHVEALFTEGSMASAKVGQRQTWPL